MKKFTPLKKKKLNWRKGGGKERAGRLYPMGKTGREDRGQFAPAKCDISLVYQNVLSSRRKHGSRRISKKGGDKEKKENRSGLKGAKSQRKKKKWGGGGTASKKYGKVSQQHRGGIDISLTRRKH